MDIDLRADFAPDGAIERLRTAYDAHIARTMMFQVQRLQDDQQALAHVRRALARAPTWDRIWLAAVREARRRGWHSLARESACRFRALNPAWARELGAEIGEERCTGPTPQVPVAPADGDE